MAEKKNENIKRARTLLDQISSDPKEQERYENKLLAQFRYNSGMAGSREYGRQEGLKEGERKGKKEGLKEGLKQGEIKNTLKIAKRMLEKGMDINVISEITKLDLEEIRNIQNNK